MTLYQRPLIVTVGLLWLLVGCVTGTPQADGGTSVPVTVLYSGGQCGGPQTVPQAFWIPRPEDAPPRNRSVIGGPEVSTRWDPEREGAVWIQMGQRPTGGYGLALAASMARVTDGVAVIQVQWREPSPEMFVPQVLTAPCLLVTLPRAGLRTVRIVDQDGVVRAQARVPQ